MKRPSLAAGAIAAVLAIALPVAAHAQGIDLRVLSNPRPEFVSGGDVLVGVTLAAGVHPATVRLTVNGADVTTLLRHDAPSDAPSDAPQRITALITRLAAGSNTLVATAGSASASLAVVNHPLAGPIISGPHEHPYLCETERFTLVAGGTAGKPLDANCSMATRVDYVYKSTSGGDLKRLADPRTIPADVATTTTSVGVEIPFIIRVETGTINRAVYEIAMPFNPAHDAPPDFTTRPSGWNGRLIYTFGGGCAGGWYKQGTVTGGVTDEVMLGRGYAVASSSLNVFANNCAELLAVETMMMVKEHFIESYGVPRATIGWGESGGSYQQLQTADGYPGLLDGIVPRLSFPEVTFGTVAMISDARLLAHYFEDVEGPLTLSEEQKRQVSGVGVLATLKAISLYPGRITVGEYCVVPEPGRYHPAKNRAGVRCDLYDHAVNVWGRDPATGFARRPLDNVGIQYGLGALNAGVISVAQFLDLNAKIGGYDNDGKLAPARTVADPVGLRIAYRSGRLTWGGAGLATTPIIDYRAYFDDRDGGDIHLRYHSFSMRERLMKANGYTDNEVMLTDDRRRGNSLRAPALRDALAQMDQWVTAIADDPSGDSPLVKLRRAKPIDLVDACWTRDDHPEKIVEPQMPASGRCNELFPTNSFPRGIAGSSLAADVIKCQLKPITTTDYAVPLTAEETTRLRQIFGSGVCDWSQPGVEQQPMAGTWQALPQ